MIRILEVTIDCVIVIINLNSMTILLIPLLVIILIIGLVSSSPSSSSSSLSSITTQKMSISIKREYAGICDDGVDKIYNDYVVTDSNTLQSAKNELKLSSSSSSSSSSESIDIDFVNEFIVLTTSHGSRINGRPVDKGNNTMTFMSMTTRDYRPNLSYKFFVIDRAGFNTCNDVPI